MPTNEETPKIKNTSEDGPWDKVPEKNMVPVRLTATGVYTLVPPVLFKLYEAFNSDIVFKNIEILGHNIPSLSLDDLFVVPASCFAAAIYTYMLNKYTCNNK